jgi:hypothetical protein
VTDREKLEMVRAVLNNWIERASWPLDDQLRSLVAKLDDQPSGREGVGQTQAEIIEQDARVRAVMSPLCRRPPRAAKCSYPI